MENKPIKTHHVTCIKMKKKHIVGTVPKSYSKFVERGKNLNTNIHDNSLSWLGTQKSVFIPYFNFFSPQKTTD